MTRTQMLALLREILHDVSTTFQAWSDTRLLMYLSEGQDKFCEETGFFRDASTHTITLVSGTAYYDVPDRVIQVLDIYNGTRRLRKIPTEDLREGPPINVYTGLADNMPEWWQTDIESGLIHVYPTPGDDQAGEELTLRVWRYSTDDLAGTSVEPEIPSRFHGAPIEWAAYRSLMHHDEETQDPVKAREHYDAFMNIYVADGRRAFTRTHNIETRITSDKAYRT